jgi:hypothetical protein
VIDHGPALRFAGLQQTCAACAPCPVEQAVEPRVEVDPVAVAQKRPPGSGEVERAAARALVALGRRGIDESVDQPAVQRELRVDPAHVEELDQRLVGSEPVDPRLGEPGEHVGAELVGGGQQYERPASVLVSAERLSHGEL